MKMLKGLVAGVKLVEMDDGSRRKISIQEYREYLSGERVDDTLVTAPTSVEVGEVIEEGAEDTTPEV